MQTRDGSKILVRSAGFSRNTLLFRLKAVLRTFETGCLAAGYITTSRFQSAEPASAEPAAAEPISSQTVAGLRFRWLFLLPVLVQLLPFQFDCSSVVAQETHRRITTSFTEPYETSKVAAAEQGIVQQILVREGQSVKQGETLAIVDDKVLQESLRLAEARAKSTARMRAAKAMLQIAETKKNNFEKLIEDGHANPSEVSQVIAEYESALAEMDLANDESVQNQIELDRIKAQIAQRRIVSPMDAVVKEIHHRKGEYISINDPKFATVVQLDRLRVRFYLHLDDLQHLKVGRSVELLLGRSQKKQAAEVEFVSPVIDPDSGTARVDLVIENPSMKIRSGIVCRWHGNPATAAARFSNHTQK